MQPTLGGQRLLEAYWLQQAPVVQVASDDRDGRLVNVGELGSRPSSRHAGLLRLQHGLVDHALVVAEPAADRQGRGDVSGVERLQFRAGVHQQQVAVAQVAVVADPVERARVITCSSDRVVTYGVTQVPGV